MPLTILYQDEHLVAVAKPAGLLVHRTHIDRRETVFAVQLLRDQLGRRVYPVHRLDKPTAGVLLFALSPEVAAALSAAWQGEQVRKTYLAVVRGWPAAEGEIARPLRELLEDVGPGRQPEERPAVTAWRRLAAVELPIPVPPHATSRYALLEVTPHTGRRHQIRRHFKSLSHPLVGDTTYGKGEHNRLFREQFDCGELLLNAVRLAFIHPLSKAQVNIDAPPSAAMQAVGRALGWEPVLTAYGTAGS